MKAAATRSQLEMLEALSDAELARKSTGWLLLELDLLRDKDKSVYTAWHVACCTLEHVARTSDWPPSMKTRRRGASVPAGAPTSRPTWPRMPSSGSASRPATSVSGGCWKPR
jgi:hypothetical protein